MSKKPDGLSTGENFESERNAVKARIILQKFVEVLDDVESEERVNLNIPLHPGIDISNEIGVRMGEGMPALDQKSAITKMLEVLEGQLENMWPEDREIADGLIIRAKLYLADQRIKGQ